MPQAALINETCVECEQDLEHCHGTAIVHFDRSGDCAEDPSCRLAVEQHLFVVSCAEVECRCGAPLSELAQPGVSWPGEQAAAS
jgi:hypothetical protein